MQPLALAGEPAMPARANPPDAVAGRARAPAHYPGLDVIRAVAALAVLACHAVQAATVWSPSWSAGRWSGLGPSISALMVEAGAWGVGIFFVLSGLCIHLPLARRLAEGGEARVGTGAYFERRFRRIYPPHLIALMASGTLAFALPLAAYGVHAMISQPTRSQLALHLLMLHSFSPDAIFSVNHVFWTIAVETHFYLLYPLLMVARRRVSMGKICASLFALALLGHLLAKALGFSDVTKMILQHSFLTRYWEWALGCWAAERLVSRPVRSTTKPASLAAMLFASWLLATAVRSFAPLGSLWTTLAIPWFFAFAVLASCGLALSRDHRLARIGRSSYSLYLVHPIALSVVLVALRAAGASSSWLEVGLGCAASLLAMQLFFDRVEARFLARRPQPALVATSA